MGPITRQIKTSWILIGVAALAVALYLNVLPNTFIFDDWQQIVDNPFLRRADGLRKILTTGVWEFLGPVGVSNFYRPLMHASFYAVFRFFQLNPAPYHVVSIALHAGVCLLVFGVILRLSRDRLTAAATALLFAAHPVHVEAVAWISAYPELMCTFFSLLAIWLYLRADDAHGRRRVILLILAGPAFLLALLAKEIAVAVPLLLAAYEWLLRGGLPRVRLRRVWPAYASLLAAFAVYLAARLHALDALFPARSKPIPLAEHLWTAIAVYFRYVWVHVWPQRLHAFYYLDRSHGPLEPAVIAGIAALAATAWLACWLHRRRLPEVLAVAFYLLPLAPAFLLPYAAVGVLMAERYAYLPSVGFCWLLAAGLAASARRRGLPRASVRWWGLPRASVLFALLLLAYSARTVTGNIAWRDEIAFYQRTITDFPGFARAYLNLGEAYMRRNRLPEALDATRAATRLDGAYPDPHVNLGLIYWRQGDSESAIRHFRLAAALGRQQGNRFVASRALTNLAVVYRNAGRLPDAVAASREALRIDPQFAGAHNNLGFALLVQGDVDGALRHFHAALALDPTMDTAYSNLGLAYAMRRQFDAALGYLRQAERLNPNNAELHARIGDVFLAGGDRVAARERYALALRLDPANQRAQAGRRAIEEGR